MIMDPRQPQAEPSTNSVVPTSVGALLAEEWTIDPYSVLPSFLEMLLIEEAGRSCRKSLENVLNAVNRQLNHHIHQQQQTSNNSNNDRNENNAFVAHTRNSPSTKNDHQNTFATPSWSSISSFLRRFQSRIIKVLAKLTDQYSPEIRCLATYLLERRFLHNTSNCATLAESIYGTVRVKMLQATDSSSSTRSPRRQLVKLSNTDKTRVALLLALGPYMREKLLRWHYKWRQRDHNSASTQQEHSRNKLRRSFCFAYPILCAVIDGSSLVCQWRYMLGQSVFYDLSTLILGQVVRRVTQEDCSPLPPVVEDPITGGDRIDEKTLTPGGFSTDSPHLLQEDEVTTKARLAARNKVVVHLIAASMTISWLTQIRAEFVRQRHERQLREEQETSSSTLTNTDQTGGLGFLPPVPPPSHSSNNNDRSCSLCRRLRKNPTASTSGHVFCLTCLLPYVKAHGRCPVTGQACSETCIVRLYEPRQEGEASS